jgi:hypothetical protein
VTPRRASNTFRFVTTWRVRGSAGEVADILRHPLDLPRWWPAVYLSASELSPPDDRGLHQRVRVQTKGFLPYTIGWDLIVTENRYPERFAIEASGDFEGGGVWTIAQDGGDVRATCDWRVHVTRPVLQRLAPLVRPLLEANYHWAMRQGRESLLVELQRRRAATPDARRAVPPPPGPVTYAAVGLLAGAAAVGGGLVYLLARQRRAAGRRERRRTVEQAD